MGSDIARRRSGQPPEKMTYYKVFSHVVPGLRDTLSPRSRDMTVHTIGIILNGVTGRMGTNQHLVRSILAIVKQGGIRVDDDLVLMPEPVLTGRSEPKLRALSEAHGGLRFTTDLDAA